MHRAIQSVLDGLYRGQDEGFQVTIPSSSCLRLVPFVVSYIFDIPEGEEMSGVWHGTTVGCPCIQCLVSRSEFRGMNFAVHGNMAGKMNACK